MTVAARSAGRSGRSDRKAPSRSEAAARSRRSARPVPSVRAATVVAGGALWALALIAALAVSSFLSVIVLAPVAAVAVVSGWRAVDARGPSGRSRGRRRRARRWPPVLIVALGASVLDPLVALGGPYAGLGILVVSTGLIVALVLASGYSASARPLRTVGARLVVAVAPSLAVTSLVVARHQGASLALVLVLAVLAYDAGAFVMGHGRSPVGGWLGVGFGLASVAVVAVFAAALMDPPFSGRRPWIVFGAVAVLAPLGVRLSQAAAGRQRLPAVRRLDSLWLAAPVWVVASALLLHR